MATLWLVLAGLCGWLVAATVLGCLLGPYLAQRDRQPRCRCPTTSSTPPIRTSTGDAH